MSAFSMAGAAVVSGIWKLAAIVLAAVLLIGGAAGGTAWWLAASARDKALADLDTSKLLVADLRAGVNAQNTAIMNLGTEKLAAEKRGAAAQQIAAVNGRRYDAALAAVAGARATTCDEAMPAVNQLLEALR